MEDEIVFGGFSPRKSGWKYGAPRCGRCKTFLSGHGAVCGRCGTFGTYNHGETR